MMNWEFAGGLAGITNIHGCINLEEWPSVGLERTWELVKVIEAGKTYTDASIWKIGRSRK